MSQQTIFDEMKQQLDKDFSKRKNAEPNQHAKNQSCKL